MLSLAHPAALALALALIPVLLLYFLRLRFRRREVGSTFIWRQLLASTSAGDRLRRRSLLLLLLQVAAVLLAAFAAAGPSLVSRRLVRPGTVFLVDVSASMAYRDGGGASRLEAAKAAVQKEALALAAGTPLMLFACSSTALPLLTEPGADRGRLLAALKGLAAGTAGFAEAPCAELLSAWLSARGGAWEACLVSDGGLDQGGRSLAASFGGALRVIGLGSSGESAGLTGLSLEKAGSKGIKADFTAWNGWPSARQLSVRLSRGARDLGGGSVEAEPGWTRQSLELEGSLESGPYTLSLVGGPREDSSAPGSVYRLALYPQRPPSILLVGRKDPFIRAALAYRGISYRSAPGFPAELSGTDMIIADSVKPPTGLKMDLLVFGEPPADAPIYARGRVTGAIVTAEPGHPLARFVAWEGARAEAALYYGQRGQALALATVDGAPVLAAWEREGYRSLACGIDLARSDLGLKSAFPVLLENFFQWCMPRVDEASAHTLVVGESARRTEERGFKVEGVDMLRTGPTVVLSPREAGFFPWNVAGGAERGFLAANVPAGELDVTPRRLEAPAQSPQLASSLETRSIPLGALAILLLALCLVAEWLIWKGGIAWLSRGLAARRAEAGRG